MTDSHPQDCSHSLPFAPDAVPVASRTADGGYWIACPDRRLARSLCVVALAGVATF